MNREQKPLFPIVVILLLFSLGLLIYASSLAVYAEEPTPDSDIYITSPDTEILTETPENPNDFESTLSISEEVQHIRQAVEVLVYFMIPASIAFLILYWFFRWFWRTFILSGIY